MLLPLIELLAKHHEPMKTESTFFSRLPIGASFRYLGESKITGRKLAEGRAQFLTDCEGNAIDYTAPGMKQYRDHEIMDLPVIWILRAAIEEKGIKFLRDDDHTVELKDGSQYSTINLADGSEANELVDAEASRLLAEYEAETWTA